MIPESENAIPFAGQDSRSLIVIRAAMLPTIHFDDQFRSVAGEVGDEMTDRDLSAEMPIGKRFPEYSPKSSLRIGHVPAKAARTCNGAGRRMVFHLLAPPLDVEGLGWGVVSGKAADCIDLTPPQPSPSRGGSFYPYFFSSTGFTQGLKAPPGTAEATGLSKPFFPDVTPNTQSSTRTCSRTALIGWAGGQVAAWQFS